MFILIAWNGTKAFSDLLVKKHNRFIFCRISEGVKFFTNFQINRLSLYSQVKSVRRLFFISFFNENFKYILETVDLSIGYQKKLENVIINVFILGLIFEK